MPLKKPSDLNAKVYEAYFPDVNDLIQSVKAQHDALLSELATHAASWQKLAEGDCVQTGDRVTLRMTSNQALPETRPFKRFQKDHATFTLGDGRFHEGLENALLNQAVGSSLHFEGELEGTDLNLDVILESAERQVQGNIEAAFEELKLSHPILQYYADADFKGFEQRHMQDECMNELSEHFFKTAYLKTVIDLFEQSELELPEALLKAQYEESLEQVKEMQKMGLDEVQAFNEVFGKEATTLAEAEQHAKAYMRDYTKLSVYAEALLDADGARPTQEDYEQALAQYAVESQMELNELKQMFPYTEFVRSRAQEHLSSQLMHAFFEAYLKNHASELEATLGGSFSS